MTPTDEPIKETRAEVSHATLTLHLGDGSRQNIEFHRYGWNQWGDITDRSTMASIARLADEVDPYVRDHLREDLR